MNISDHPRELLAANAATLRFHNSNLSVAAARRMACQLAPRVAKQAGLTTEAAITEFANAREGSSFANTNAANPQAEARQSILAKAQNRVFHTRCTLANAVREICSINMALAREASLTTPAAQTELANASGASDGMDGSFTGTIKKFPSGQALPISPGGVKPATVTTENGLDHERVVALCLPLDSSKEEFETASSVGSKNQVQIWKALVKLAMKNLGTNEDNASLWCSGRYPKLKVAANAAGLIKALPIKSGDGVSRAV